MASLSPGTQYPTRCGTARAGDLHRGVGERELRARPRRASFDFPNFPNNTNLLINNPTETTIVDNRLRLTNNANDQEGSAYYVNQVDVTKSFENIFDFQVTLGNGADGFVWMLQRQAATALGGGGGSLGSDLGAGGVERVVLEVKRERQGVTQKRRVWVPRAQLPARHPPGERGAAAADRRGAPAAGAGGDVPAARVPGHAGLAGDGGSGHRLPPRHRGAGAVARRR